jgi:hypothetical protein
MSQPRNLGVAAAVFSGFFVMFLVASYGVYGVSQLCREACDQEVARILAIAFVALIGASILSGTVGLVLYVVREARFGKFGTSEANLQHIQQRYEQI